MIEQLLQRVFDYAYDVVEGKIKAGRKHILACQRFLNDTEQLEKDDYPFYFEAEELEQFYEWSKMFKHRKGEMAGKNIDLTDFQLFLATNIFCWKRKSNGARRFRKAYIQLARKNAKTQFLAILTSYAAFLSDETEECYIAGWSREQSSICYEEVLGQIGTCELLQGKYTDSYGKIKHHKSGSIIQPLSREARKTGDGKNPSIAVIDEYHAHETSEIYDVMVSGMVARKNRLIAIITTAGFDMSNPCYTEYQYVSRMLDPEDETENNDEYFVMICELDPEDDIKDETVWIKANPIVATYESGIDSLRSELKIALEVPEKMRAFLTKNMDKWVDQKENGYMPMNKWDDCYTEEKFDLKKYPCFAGVDLSQTTDLTSVGLVFDLGKKYFVRQHSFIPEDRLRERMQTDKVRYDLWVQQGWLTTTPGSVVDYNFIESYFMKLRDQGYQIKEIDYDKWNATHFAQNMDAEGFMIVEIPQSIRQLSEPTKAFRSEVYQGNILHEKDPLLRWAINNAILRMDPQENIMLDKSKSKNRIDPIAAVINGFARASVMTEVNLNDHILSEGFSF